MVLVVANEEFRIDREDVNKALDSPWQEVIGVLEVVKPIAKHLALLYELWNFAGVDVNDVSGVVHDVVSEHRADVVRNLGQQVPNRLLGLVLPLLVLNVVPQKRSELKLVRKREIGLVELLKRLWSCQC